MDLLLVGAGHTHLHLVRQPEQLVTAGYRVRLLSPPTFHYSGVASAAAIGDISPGLGQIDVAALATNSGVRHYAGVLAGINLDDRYAIADDGTELAFDVICFNIGSVTAPGSMEVDASVLRVKPLSNLSTLQERLRGPLPVSGSLVTVVGGGSSGLELAAHLATRPDVAQVHLLEAGSHLGPDLPQGARRRVERLLSSRGVRVRTNCEVMHLAETSTRCADGTVIGHDLAVLATGLEAPSLVTHLGLGDHDGIPVRATLQHRDHDHVYAAGDCAHFLPHPLTKIGVHGVRQGPVLQASLLARVRGDPLPTYVPQTRALSVLDLGAGLGLAVRGRRWWLGRSALMLKRWIDRRWLRQYGAG